MKRRRGEDGAEGRKTLTTDADHEAVLSWLQDILIESEAEQLRRIWEQSGLQPDGLVLLSCNDDDLLHHLHIHNFSTRRKIDLHLSSEAQRLARDPLTTAGYWHHKEDLVQAVLAHRQQRVPPSGHVGPGPLLLASNQQPSAHTPQRTTSKDEATEGDIVAHVKKRRINGGPAAEDPLFALNARRMSSDEGTVGTPGSLGAQHKGRGSQGPMEKVLKSSPRVKLSSRPSPGTKTGPLGPHVISSLSHGEDMLDAPRSPRNRTAGCLDDDPLSIKHMDETSLPPHDIEQGNQGEQQLDGGNGITSAAPGCGKLPASETLPGRQQVDLSEDGVDVVGEPQADTSTDEIDNGNTEARNQVKMDVDEGDLSVLPRRLSLSDFRKGLTELLSAMEEDVLAQVAKNCVFMQLPWQDIKNALENKGKAASKTVLIRRMLSFFGQDPGKLPGSFQNALGVEAPPGLLLSSAGMLLRKGSKLFLNAEDPEAEEKLSAPCLDLLQLRVLLEIIPDDILALSSNSLDGEFNKDACIANLIRKWSTACPGPVDSSNRAYHCLGGHSIDVHLSEAFHPGSIVDIFYLLEAAERGDVTCEEVDLVHIIMTWVVLQIQGISVHIAIGNSKLRASFYVASASLMSPRVIQSRLHDTPWWRPWMVELMGEKDAEQFETGLQAWVLALGKGTGSVSDIQHRLDMEETRLAQISTALGDQVHAPVEVMSLRQAVRSCSACHNGVVEPLASQEAVKLKPIEREVVSFLTAAEQDRNLGGTLQRFLVQVPLEGDKCEGEGLLMYYNGGAQEVIVCPPNTPLLAKEGTTVAFTMLEEKLDRVACLKALEEAGATTEGSQKMPPTCCPGNFELHGGTLVITGASTMYLWKDKWEARAPGRGSQPEPPGSQTTAAEVDELQTSRSKLQGPPVGVASQDSGGSHLGVHLYHGINKAGSAQELCRYELVVTTHQMVANSLAAFREVNWRRVVIDDFQLEPKFKPGSPQTWLPLPTSHYIFFTSPASARESNVRSTPSRHNLPLRSPLSQNASHSLGLDVHIIQRYLKQVAPPLEEVTRRMFSGRHRTYYALSKLFYV